MEDQLAQIETFIGYENVLQDAIKSAQKAANLWLSYNKIPVNMISVAAQTIAEITPSQDQVFYVHVITVVYPRASSQDRSFGR